MNNIFKKILSTVVGAVMLMLSVSITVFAEGTPTYSIKRLEADMDEIRIYFWDTDDFTSSNTLFYSQGSEILEKTVINLSIQSKFLNWKFCADILIYNYQTFISLVLKFVV